MVAEAAVDLWAVVVVVADSSDSLDVELVEHKPVSSKVLAFVAVVVADSSVSILAEAEAEEEVEHKKMNNETEVVVVEVGAEKELGDDKMGVEGNSEGDFGEGEVVERNLKHK